MAFFAVGAELVVVWVFVAVMAVFKGDTVKLLKNFSLNRFLLVAFGALHGFVFACQYKIGFIVVESARRGKIVGTMAFGAIISQRFSVYIFMTRVAFGVKS